jgi:formate dehydrogenase subunit gamma
MGKFNAGQKLNATFVLGTIPVMLATGGIMRWFSPVPLDWRTGATFVHDWIAIALLLVILGHIAKALIEPYALSGMVRGRVPSKHAERHHPRWWAEVTADGTEPSDP